MVRNARHENPPPPRPTVPAKTRTWDHEHAHGIPHHWATPPGPFIMFVKDVKFFFIMFNDLSVLILCKAHLTFDFEAPWVGAREI